MTLSRSRLARAESSGLTTFVFWKMGLLTKLMTAPSTAAQASSTSTTTAAGVRPDHLVTVTQGRGVTATHAYRPRR